MACAVCNCAADERAFACNHAAMHAVSFNSRVRDRATVRIYDGTAIMVSATNHT